MERSLNLFLLMTAFAQILALGFTLRIGRLVPGRGKRSAVIKLLFGFSILFEGLVIILVLGITQIFDLSLGAHVLGTIIGISMLIFGRIFNRKVLDEQFRSLEKNSNPP